MRKPLAAIPSPVDNNSNFKSFHRVMRYYLTSLICVFLFQFYQGQDTLRKYEFGTTVMTLNLYNQNFRLFEDRPRQEILNGIFFRYSRNRAGIRATLSYVTNFSSFGQSGQPYSSGAGTLMTKDFRAGCGGQFTFLKKVFNLYVLSDFAYRLVISEGNISGGVSGINDNYTATTHGVDTHFGLGFRIKLFRIIYISPEFSYNVAYGRVIRRSESVTSKNVYKSSYTDGNANPVIRLHFSIAI